MTSVLPADSTYAAIEKKVRRLTVSASESALSSADIQRAVNTFMTQDFPYAIKIDQLRSVYKFLTIPNVDRYPVDVNNQMGYRDPVYIGGIRANFFKNRDQLFNLYPRFPTLFKPVSGDGETTSFTFSLYNGSSNAYPANNTGILSSQVVIGGIDVNGNPIRVIDDGGAVATSGGVGANTTQGRLLYLLQDVVGNNVYVDSTKGGYVLATAQSEPAADGNDFYEEDLLGFIRGTYPNASIVPGTLQLYFDFGGANETLYQDDGYGRVTMTSGTYTVSSGTIDYRTSVVTLNFTVTPAAAITVQGDFSYYQVSTTSGLGNAIPPLSPLPYPSPPIVPTPQYCGTVDYVTTQMTLNLPVPPAAGSQLTVWAVTYVPGRPYNLLFWNNEFTIRPVPNGVYLVEIECFQSPAQFIDSTEDPTIKQWWQYIAYGAAMEILRERQDFDGVDSLMEGFKRQEALVLERQAIEGIGQPNITLFNSTMGGFNSGWGWGWGGY